MMPSGDGSSKVLDAVAICGKLRAQFSLRLRISEVNVNTYIVRKKMSYVV